MAMPGMSGPAEAGNPALALVLALFMAGYILWTTDQLASLSKAQGRRTRPQAGRGRPARAQAGKCRALTDPNSTTVSLAAPDFALPVMARVPGGRSRRGPR